MKERFVRLARLRGAYFGAVIVITLSVVSLAMACQFWGMVGSQDVGNYAQYTTNHQWLCDAANGAYDPYPWPCPHGWASVWCIPNPNGTVTTGVVRDELAIYDTDGSCVDAFDNVVTTVGTNGSHLVMSHARRKSTHTPPLPVIDDPHPFVYKLWNNTWTWMHNGGLNDADMDEVEDAFGAGFAALDQFVDRPWTSWYHPAGVDTINDSEYLAMLLMRNLMVAKNYYWQHDSLQTDAEFAVNKTFSRCDPWVSSALNSALACKDTIWLMEKYVAGNTTHRVSYLAPTGTDSWLRMVSTANRAGWTQMNQTQDNNKFVRLYPGGVVRRDSLPVLPDAQTNPQELRINEREYSSGDENFPAISTDPKRSTFVVAWEAKNAYIQARSYNQMGLAEDWEFPVSLNGAFARRTPAIAHSFNGDTIIVAWSEQPTINSNFSTIKTRRLIWNQGTHTWVGDPTETVVNIPSASYDVSHPNIAVSPFGYAVVWERTDRHTGARCTRISSIMPMAIMIDVELDTGNPGMTPDITYIPNSATNYVATWSENTVTLGYMMARGIYNNGSTLGPPIILSNMAGDAVAFNPAITSSPTMGPMCAIGYFSANAGRVKAMRLAVDVGGRLAILEDLSGETLRSAHPDIALQNGAMVITYAKPVANFANEIFAAVQTGGGFGLPILLNVPNVTDQLYPAIAISQVYNCTSARPLEIPSNYYLTISNDDRFNTRRMVVWATDRQDGDRWGVAGRFQGVSGVTPSEWYDVDGVNGMTMDALLVCGDSDPLPPPKDGTIQQNGGLVPETAPTTAIPAEYRLYPVSPNPFNPVTTARFDLPEMSAVRLEVYDITGRLVRTLIDETRGAGTYSLSVDGSVLSSGTYFLRMQAGSYTATEKLLLMK